MKRCTARAVIFEGDDKMHTRCLGHDGHDGDHVGDWADRVNAPRWSGDFETITRP